MYYLKLTYPRDLSGLRGAWLENLEFGIQDILHKKGVEELDNVMDYVPDDKKYDKNTIDMSDDLPKIIYACTMNFLDTFFDNLKLPMNTEKTALAKQFGKYLLDKIGDEIYPSIENSLISIINKEQRPLVHIGDIMYEVAKIIKHPQFDNTLQQFIHKCTNIFSGKTVEVKRVQLFGDEWTQAYKLNLIDRISDEICQVIFVNLLNPLVFKCIQKTLTTVVS
jgi:hypothetical protein